MEPGWRQDSLVFQVNACVDGISAVPDMACEVYSVREACAGELVVALGGLLVVRSSHLRRELDVGSSYVLRQRCR